MALSVESSRLNQLAPQHSYLELHKKENATQFPQVSDVMLEVDSLADPEQKRKLLYHQFRAQVKEEIGLPFHSYAMSLRLRKQVSGRVTFELHDDLYLDSNVLERCQRAIDTADTSSRHKRFNREKKQVERLVEAIENEVIDLEKNGHTILHLISSEETLPLPDRWDIVQALLTQGWRDASLITTEVSQQFQIKQNQRCLAGPKFFYIMPKSSVHKGWQTMYLIAQPVYLPESDRWLVLQDQHMTDASWQDYEAILARLNPSYQNIAFRPFFDRKKEGRVMDECIELDTKYQTESATTVFLNILYEGTNKETRSQQIIAQQQRLLQIYGHLEKSFNLHSTYLLKILAIENGWDPTWTLEKRERLLQAYTNTYSSLYHQQNVNEDQITSWIEQHYQLYNQPEKRNNPTLQRRAYRSLSAAQRAPWLLLAVESKLECSLLSLPALISKPLFDFEIFSAVKNNSLSISQLESIIGEERAKRWKWGECIACKKESWIGDKDSGKECDVCIKCEMIDNGINFDQEKQFEPTNSSLSKKSTLKQPSTSYARHQYHSISLSQLLAGDTHHPHRPRTL